MGVRVVEQAEGGRCPITIRGHGRADADRISSTPVASAQIKSAVLLAGLNSPGRTTVIETEASPRPYGKDAGLLRRRRDRRAVMAKHGRKVVAARPARSFRPRPIVVPADPSSAAFSPWSPRPDRAGFRRDHRGRDDEPAAHRPGHHAAARWGPRSKSSTVAIEGGEDVADLRVRAALAAKASTCRPARAPSMIDEYPDPRRRSRLSPPAETRMRGLQELQRQGIRPARRRSLPGLKEAGVAACHRGR